VKRSNIDILKNSYRYRYVAFRMDGQKNQPLNSPGGSTLQWERRGLFANQMLNLLSTVDQITVMCVIDSVQKNRLNYSHFHKGACVLMRYDYLPQRTTTDRSGLGLGVKD